MLIILALGLLSLFVLKAAIFKVLLFCAGLDAYNGYFLYIGKKLKGERVDNPYKYIFFGRDHNRYDFVILLVFFGAILLIFKGPMILFQVLFAQKLNEMLSSLGQWAIIFNIFILIGYVAYKISLYSAISNLTYHGNEVLESFKNGVKGIWKFKMILVALLLIEVAASLLAVGQNIVINNTLALSYNVIPAMLMIFMSCSYSITEATDDTRIKPAISQKNDIDPKP